jgi:hypothetical protein
MGPNVKTRLELAVLVEEMCADSSDSVRASALRVARSLRLDQDPPKEDACLVLLYLLDRERAARVASIPKKKKSSSAKPAAVVEPGPPRSAFAERIRDQILGDSESEDEANSSAAKELRRKLGLPISDQRGRRGFRQGEGS